MSSASKTKVLLLLVILCVSINWRASAMSIIDVSNILGDSAKAVSTLIDAVKKIYDTRRYVEDDQKARMLRSSLRNLANKMAEVNGQKQNLQEALNDYIKGFDTPRKNELWLGVKESLSLVAPSLDLLIKQLEDDGIYLTQVAGIETSSDLRASLAQQKLQYSKLTQLEEPRTVSELQGLKAAADKLGDLLKKVKELEMALNTVIKT